MKFADVSYSSLFDGLVDPKKAKGMKPEDASILVRTKVAVPAIKAAIGNHQSWKNLLNAKQEEAKKILASAEGKVEEMNQKDWIPNPFTIGEVKGAIDILAAIAKHLKEVNEEYSKAFAADGMRSNDLGVPIRKLFPQIDGKYLEELKNFVGQARAKIIAEDRAGVAIRDRIAEYVKRAEILAKAAQAAQDKAFDRSQNQKATIAEALADAGKSLKACAVAIESIGKKLKAFDVALKAKVDSKTRGLFQGLIGEREEVAKGAAGAHKTAVQALTLAKKLLADAPSLQRAMKPELTKLELEGMKLKAQIDQYRTKDFPALDKEIAKLGVKI